MADPEGAQGVRSNPSPPNPIPVFEYHMKMKYFGLNETKLFHVHGMSRKYVIQLAKLTPTLYTPRNPGSAPAPPLKPIYLQFYDSNFYLKYYDIHVALDEFLPFTLRKVLVFCLLDICMSIR